ncbi:hypothetical protein [Pseudoclavibacter soli]|uniref:hypothetical protein n=1 Tax=Pseudoclavibacter soli TaxID=452623 RepID=UPI000409749E|nr:hypothetical protein [Pseudoclavibacter soli]
MDIKTRKIATRLTGVVSLVALAALGASGCTVTTGASVASETPSSSVQERSISLVSDAFAAGSDLAQDDAGEYTPLIVKDGGPLLADTSSLWDESVVAAGFDAEDVAQAQAFAVEVFADVVDSPAFGSSNAVPIIESMYRNQVFEADISASDSIASLLINHTYDPLLPVPISDGDTHWSSLNAEITAVKTLEVDHDGGPYLEFDYSYSGNYRVDDASALQSVEAKLGVGEEAALPLLTDEAKDGVGENACAVSGTYRLSVTQRDGQWLVTGWQSDYSGTPMYTTV